MGIDIRYLEFTKDFAGKIFVVTTSTKSLRKSNFAVALRNKIFPRLYFVVLRLSLLKRMTEIIDGLEKTYFTRHCIRPVHEITAGHQSLSGTISCVTDRIRFLPVTMTGRYSNFNSTSYAEDRHKVRVTGTKY